MTQRAESVPGVAHDATAISPEEQATLERYAIRRVPQAIYEVGGYRYSALADAVAQARRDLQLTGNSAS